MDPDEIKQKYFCISQYNLDIENEFNNTLKTNTPYIKYCNNKDKDKDKNKDTPPVVEDNLHNNILYSNLPKLLSINQSGINENKNDFIEKLEDIVLLYESQSEIKNKKTNSYGNYDKIITISKTIINNHKDISKSKNIPNIINDLSNNINDISKKSTKKIREKLIKIQNTLDNDIKLRHLIYYDEFNTIIKKLSENKSRLLTKNLIDNGDGNVNKINEILNSNSDTDMFSNYLNANPNPNSNTDTDTYKYINVYLKNYIPSSEAASASSEAAQTAAQPAQTLAQTAAPNKNIKSIIQSIIINKYKLKQNKNISLLFSYIDQYVELKKKYINNEDESKSESDSEFDRLNTEISKLQVELSQSEFKDNIDMDNDINNNEIKKLKTEISNYINYINNNGILYNSYGSKKDYFIDITLNKSNIDYILNTSIEYELNNKYDKNKHEQNIKIIENNDYLKFEYLCKLKDVYKSNIEKIIKKKNEKNEKNEYTITPKDIITTIDNNMINSIRQEEYNITRDIILKYNTDALIDLYYKEEWKKYKEKKISELHLPNDISNDNIDINITVESALINLVNTYTNKDKDKNVNKDCIEELLNYFTRLYTISENTDAEAAANAAAKAEAAKANAVKAVEEEANAAVEEANTAVEEANAVKKAVEEEANAAVEGAAEANVVVNNVVYNTEEEQEQQQEQQQQLQLQLQLQEQQEQQNTLGIPDTNFTDETLNDTNIVYKLAFYTLIFLDKIGLNNINGKDGVTLYKKDNSNKNLYEWYTNDNTTDKSNTQGIKQRFNLNQNFNIPIVNTIVNNSITEIPGLIKFINTLNDDNNRIPTYGDTTDLKKDLNQFIKLLTILIKKDNEEFKTYKKGKKYIKYDDINKKEKFKLEKFKLKFNLNFLLLLFIIFNEIEQKKINKENTELKKKLVTYVNFYKQYILTKISEEKINGTYIYENIGPFNYEITNVFTELKNLKKSEIEEQIKQIFKNNNLKYRLDFDKIIQESNSNNNNNKTSQGGSELNNPNNPNNTYTYDDKKILHVLYYQHKLKEVEQSSNDTDCNELLNEVNKIMSEFKCKNQFIQIQYDSNKYKIDDKINIIGQTK